MGETHNVLRDNISSNFVGYTSFLALNYVPGLGPFCEYLNCVVCIPTYRIVSTNSYISYVFGYKFVSMNLYNTNVICTNSYVGFHIFMLIQFLLLLILGDNWQDIKDEHGRHLVIGEFSFNKKRSEGFTASNKCRDVLAAMELSGKLLLEHYSVHDSYSNISDSLMKIIKGTSANEGVNNNSIGRVNKTLIRFFIDMLSLQLVFDNWYVSIRIL